MIDWLRGDMQHPEVEVDGHALPIAIRRHARARRLTMRLAPDGSELRITLPTWGRTRDAFAFAKARESWIAEQLSQVPQTQPVAPGSAIPFRGGRLQLDWQADAPRKPGLAGDRLLAGGPRESLPGRVQRWLESEALALSGEDLERYCRRAGHPVPALRISRAKRRWGSCSSNGKSGRCIRINWRLVMAPDAVRKSVVAHEVAHLSHFDHSPAFHALLSQLYEGDISEADDWLRREGRSLYAIFS